MNDKRCTRPAQFFAVCVTALAVTGCSTAPPEPPVLPAAEPLTIHAWWSIPAGETTVERYRELAGAGFTTSMSPLPDADTVARALDCAAEAGVGLFVFCPELRSDPEGTVRRFMGHPALAGWHLRDEPNAADFADLGEWTRRIQAVDDAHPCYINLFPTYATPEQLGTDTYSEHIGLFIAEVPVPFISFDHYPVTDDGLREDYYENLRIVSDAAAGAGRPFWAFALSVDCETYRHPTVPYMKLQMYSNLAYGASALQYFTYWTPEGSDVWKFTDAPIGLDGERSPMYERVREVTAELQARAEVFSGATVLTVGHAGIIPPGTEGHTVMDPVTAIDVAGPGSGAVVSWLRNGGRTFLMLVGGDLDAAVTATVEFARGTTVWEIGPDGSMTHVTGTRAERTLGTGDARIFTWD